MTQLIYVIDDDAEFSTALARLLRLHGYDVAQFDSADRFLKHIAAGASPGCILLDVSMPGLSGPELQCRLAERGCRFPIVFVTGHGDVPTTVRAIKAGAEDFLTKPVSDRTLLASIERAFVRSEAERKQQDWFVNARAQLGKLTAREREVFEHVVRGNMNKQTAWALGITERTIKAHRQRICDKLGMHSIADLVLLAERVGILSEQFQATSHDRAESGLANDQAVSKRP